MDLTDYTVTPLSGGRWKIEGRVLDDGALVADFTGAQSSMVTFPAIDGVAEMVFELGQDVLRGRATDLGVV